MNSSNKSNPKPDRESLMALHALLQIRSESATGSAEEEAGEQTRQEAEEKLLKHARKRAKKMSTQAAARAHEHNSSQSAMFASPSSARLPSLSTPVPFGQTSSLKNLQTANGKPIHGFMNFAPAPPPMSSTVAQFSAAIGALMHPMPINFNQRLFTAQLHPESEVQAHFANSSVVSMPSSKEQLSPSGTQRFMGREVVDSVQGNDLMTRDPHGITPATSPSPAPDDLIRREEVEAALKSRPQRGRKRENLSVLERLELTRTRNREHAKSTRNRKKQRYQELIDNEHRLQSLQLADDLNLQRRQCVIKFVNIREQMLNNLRNGGIECSIVESSRKQASLRSNPRQLKCINGKERGSVSFYDLQETADHSDENKEDLSCQRVDAGLEAGTSETRAVVLKDVIENLSSFIFNSSQLGQASWVRPEGVQALTGVTQMKGFDNSLLALLQQHMTEATIPPLCYQIEGLIEGVAVNAEGLGFARVNLVFEASEGRPSQVLLSSILTMQFAAQSDKLTAVEWSILQDRISSRLADSDRQGGQDSRSDSGDSLGSQTVYPSVVSLDHNISSSGSEIDNHHKERVNEVDEGQGPGMNI